MIKNLAALLLITVFNISVFAQNNYSEGYYIDSQNNRIEGLIKNLDWNKNPQYIEFKSDIKSSSSKKISAENLKEFEITNVTKYTKFRFNLDTSSDNINMLTESKEPIFQTSEALLKVLIEGEFSLYLYSEGDSKRFYYKTNEGVIPLIHKRYLINSNNVAENNQFLEQLKELGNCGVYKDINLKNIRYSESDISNFFVKLNECKNANYKIFEKSKSNFIFHLSLRPGVNFNKLDVTTSYLLATPTTEKFESKTTLRLGLEAEFVLPFNNHKWSIIVEPTYQSYKGYKEFYTSTILNEQVLNSREIKYSSIELPLGVRYYLFLHKESRLFINAAVVFDAVMKDSELIYKDYNFTDRKYEVRSGSNFAFGIGYKYNSFSLEANVKTSRELFVGDMYNSSKYNSFSMIFGYTLF